MIRICLLHRDYKIQFRVYVYGVPMFLSLSHCPNIILTANDSDTGLVEIKILIQPMLKWN